MAVEKKRGCGYRKVGGTYLVSEGRSVPCDRLPIRLDVCPVCSHGFKQSRGWTWVDLAGLVGGEHMVGDAVGLLGTACPCSPFCPLCKTPTQIGKAGLMWIGERFYKTPDEFMIEGRELGFSRRIKALPRNFKVGETWVMLAHSKTIRENIPADELDAENPGLVEGGVEVRYVPGIFTLWQPTRVERICKESERDSDLVKELLEKGITPVFVPDNDPDHAGTVYDKPDEVEDETEVAV